MVSIIRVASLLALPASSQGISGGDGPSSKPVDSEAAMLSGALMPFSWNTVPVFFHSMNHSGPWSEEALRTIAKFSMATFEKAHAADVSNHSEQGLPPDCRRLKAIGGTASAYYLHSFIDWPFYSLHDQLAAHPEWRMKDEDGKDLLVYGQWAFNLTIPALQDMWIDDCVTATENGCGGCFVDGSNNVTQPNSEQRLSPEQAEQFQLAHMAMLKRLDARLGAAGKFAILNNQAKLEGGSVMMFENFAASEKCIYAMQNATARGYAVQAHAGDFQDGGDQQCAGGVTNSLAAFLIGAAERSYYNCAPVWDSNPEWPAVADFWLDYRDEFSRPLGAPTGPAVKGADGVWRREFAAGVSVSFDASRNNGTIVWADGSTQVGIPGPEVGKGQPCSWATLGLEATPRSFVV